MMTRSLTRPRIGLLLACSILWASNAAAAQEADSWRPYESDAGGFSVELPAEPIVQEKKTWFPMASFISYAYRAIVGNDAFGMNHTDLPKAVTWIMPNSSILDSTRKGLLEDVNATEISYREVVFGNQPAHELIYDMPPQDGKPRLRGTATIFFREQRLYVFWAEVTPERPKADLERFFASVRIWQD
jgi:hypothetical protein